MNPEFTPGSWEIDEDADDESRWRSIVAWTPSPGGASGITLTDIVGEATTLDIKAMAAGKDLYLALSELVKAANNGADLTPHYDEDIDELWAQAKAALKKVEEN